VFQKRDAIYGFPFQVEECSLGDYPSAPVARAMLNGALATKLKASAAHNSHHYEKVFLRLNRSGGGFFTTQPERSGGRGLLSSLLWLPRRLLP